LFILGGVFVSKNKFSKEFKLAIINSCKEGKLSIREIASLYGVNRKTIYEWVYRYEKYGIEDLEQSRAWKSYSKELKLSAIHDYLSGQYSLREVTRKYKLSSNSILRLWLRKYNSHREIKDSSKGKTISMTNGKKTSLNERIQIVLYCLEHNKNYQMAAETYEVSYQQVYQWVKKYEAGGEEALKDKRGRNKEEQELTPEEKFKLEMKRLESENERLRAENAFLKKLEELERRRL
jgi:transposase-like protein